jgi:hypothetical protein
VSPAALATRGDDTVLKARSTRRALLTVGELYGATGGALSFINDPT